MTVIIQCYVTMTVPALFAVCVCVCVCVCVRGMGGEFEILEGWFVDRCLLSIDFEILGWE